MKQIVEKQKQSKIDTTANELIEEENDKRATKGIDIALGHGVTEMIEQVKFFKVGSQSDPDRKYLVKEVHDKNQTSFSCNCKDYENFYIKGDYKHECKHIIAVQFAKQYNLTLEEVKSVRWSEDLYDF